MVDLPIEQDDDQEEIEIDDPELLAALEEAEQQIDRGECIDGFELLRRIREGTWREE